MKVDRIYIGDLGIFKNATMDDISSGMVIIGGLNRAGKSTFMEAIRNLAWGFQKSSTLPPPNVEYALESDITADTGERFNIKIQGYGEPRLYPISTAPNLTMRDIYNVDKYTYKELYTISLDELNNISGSHSKLQAVLLGAGFKEAVHLPEIIKEFSREAERIGGKRGNPSTKMFKSYSRIISTAVKDKEKALNEAEEYAAKESSLKETLEGIQEDNKELENTENSIIVLDVLKENYRDIKRYKEIENKLAEQITVSNSADYDRIKLIEVRKLKEKYISAVKEFNENCSLFKRTTNMDLKFKDKLLENRNIILKLGTEVSGFKERLKAHNVSKTRWEEDKKSIIMDIRRVNESFCGSFKEILDIKCDDLQIGELNKIDEDLREAERSIEQWNNKKNGLNTQIGIYEDTKERFKARSTGVLNYINIILLWLLVINILAVIYGVIRSSSVYLFTSLILLAVSSCGVLYVNKNKGIASDKSMDVEEQLLRLKSEMQACDASLKIANDKKNYGLEILKHYKKILLLDENTSALSIKDYVISLQNIKNRIVNLSLAKNGLEGTENRLKNDLYSFSNIHKNLGMPVKESGDLESYNYYADEIEKIVSWLPTAVSLEESERNLEALKYNIEEIIGIRCDNSSIEEAIEKYIEKCIEQEKIENFRLEYETLKKSLNQVLQSERVRDGFSSYKDKKESETPLAALFNICSKYSGINDIELNYEKLKSDKEIIKRRIEELNEKSQRLKNELEGIMISDKIRNAQETIDNARGGMRPLAEKYAVYAAASFILNAVYKDFMDKTQDSLLKRSAEVLKSITGGEYINILPPEEIQSVDFKTRNRDGMVYGSSNSLSRATREQLYLSVRINRILQNPCSLPVIIDDSFVNFDTIHIKHAMEIISELSKANQVFILTCHPYMVECASALNKKAQYWKLEKGRFYNSDKESLRNYLSFH